MNIYIQAYCRLTETGYPDVLWEEVITDIRLDRECHCFDIIPEKLVCDPNGPQALSIFVELPNTQLAARGDYNISVSLYANNPELKD